MPQSFLLLLCSFMLTINVGAQLKLVTGTVKKSIGHAVIANAVVRVKNMNVCTTTDYMGNFKLQVPAKMIVIKINAPGFKEKEISVNAWLDSSYITVMLNPLQKLVKTQEKNRYIMQHARTPTNKSDLKTPSLRRIKTY